MLASPSRAKITCYDAACGGHAEVAQVDVEVLGQLCSAVSVFVVPVGVQLRSWRFGFLLDCDVSQHDGVYSSHLAVNGSLSCNEVLCAGMVWSHSQEQ